MKEIIKKAREWLEEEVRQHGGPHFLSLTDISYQKGVQLAEEFEANVDVVKIGVLLMDIKLAEAKNMGRAADHAKISAEASKFFLNNLGVEEGICRKIVNCIEAHHGKVPYNCLEAEICANADCYKFIHPKGVFIFLEHLGHERENLEENLKQLEYKLDEKHAILSLEICKKELEEYYKMFKKLIADTKI